MNERFCCYQMLNVWTFDSWSSISSTIGHSNIKIFLKKLLLHNFAFLEREFLEVKTLVLYLIKFHAKDLYSALILGMYFSKVHY